MHMERELLLLGLLRRGDTHGYRLHEFINNYMASCTDLKKPTAYYLLDKMADKGWIEQMDEQSGSHPPRRVYSLTPAGEAAFQRLLRENLAAYHPAHFAGDVGLAFLDALNAGEARDLLQQRREIIAAKLAESRATPPHSGSMQFVIDHATRHLEAELAWLDDVLANLATDNEET